MKAPGTSNRNHVPHLWVFLTAEDSDGNFLLAPISSDRHYKDQTVILESEDHPWLRHSSVIEYDKTSKYNIRDIQRLVKEGRAYYTENRDSPRLLKPFSAEVLKRAQEGLLKSKMPPRKTKKYYRERVANCQEEEIEEIVDRF